MDEYTSDDLDLKDRKSEYTVGERLGCGGFGVVFEIREKFGSSRTLVLKVAKNSDRKNRQTFTGKQLKSIAEMEISILEKMQQTGIHPNIVRLETHFEATLRTEKAVCLVLEFCHDGDLSDDIDQGKYRIFINKITNSMVLALDYCARNKIVHLDVKPANILVKRETKDAFSFKLGDFGLAHFTLDRDSLSSQAGGSQGYTSPEVLNNPCDATFQSDIYSLGVTLRHVLYKDNKVKFMTLQNNPGIYDINPEGFSELDSSTAVAINSMIKFDPARRASAQQLLQILQVFTLLLLHITCMFASTPLFSLYSSKFGILCAAGSWSAAPNFCKLLCALDDASTRRFLKSSTRARCVNPALI
jgi:serine/threonine protein kinase KIN1/2